MDRGAWRATVWGDLKELDATEHTGAMQVQSGMMTGCQVTRSLKT